MATNFARMHKSSANNTTNFTKKQYFSGYNNANALTNITKKRAKGYKLLNLFKNIIKKL